MAPTPPPPTVQQRDRALDRLKVLTPTQAIRDPELNQALAPFRGHSALALLCGNATCMRPFLWCSLDPMTARVRFSPTEPPRVGEHDPAPAPPSSPPPTARRPWYPRDEVGESVAAPGEPMLRWRFHCPRCNRPCVLSNHRMITLLLRALASGRTAVRPAAE